MRFFVIKYALQKYMIAAKWFAKSFYVYLVVSQSNYDMLFWVKFFRVRGGGYSA